MNIHPFSRQTSSCTLLWEPIQAVTGRTQGDTSHLARTFVDCGWKPRLLIPATSKEHFCMSLLPVVCLHDNCSPSLEQTFPLRLQLTLTSLTTQFYWQNSQSAVLCWALSKAPSAFRLAGFLPRSQTFGDHFPLCLFATPVLLRSAV